MSTNLHPSLETLHHDAVFSAESAELLVGCLKITRGAMLADAKAKSAVAWDVVANLDVALRAAP